MDDDAKNDPKNEAPSCPGVDELTAGPLLPGGVRPFLRHTADHQIQAGILTPIGEGEPIYEGAVALEHKGGDRYNVTELRPKTDDQGHKGPARVNSKKYLTNYDAIFGNKTVGQA